MDLATAIKSGPTPVTPGNPCGLGLILNTLHGDELAALYVMLDDRHWNAADIARALTDNGHSIKRAAVARHRRGECKCEAL